MRRWIFFHGTFTSSTYRAPICSPIIGAYGESCMADRFALSSIYTHDMVVHVNISRNCSTASWNACIVPPFMWMVDGAAAGNAWKRQGQQYSSRLLNAWERKGADNSMAVIIDQWLYICCCCCEQHGLITREKFPGKVSVCGCCCDSQAVHTRLAYVFSFPRQVEREREV